MAVVLGLLASAARAQSPAKSGAADTLQPVVVTAERSRTSLTAVTSAVTRLTAEELVRGPHVTLADVLRRVPGFAVVDIDGLGRDPQVMVRGFYGGGEAEYVVVLVDGRPFARLESGLVSWDVLPSLESIEAVEVVRGGTSALYGDAAVGAVINVLTRKTTTGARTRWEAGSEGALSGSLDVAGRPFGGSTAVSGGFDRVIGFRSHGRRLSGQTRATHTVIERETSALSLSFEGRWRDVEEPGPLLESLLAGDRDQSDTLFRFDRTEEQEYSVALEGERRLFGRAHLSGLLSTGWRDMEAVRTLALAPGFGDTRMRTLRTARHAASVEADVPDSPLPGADVLVLGVEAATVGLDSKYHGMVSGDRAAYAASSGARGELDASGEGRRNTAAAFAQYAVPLSGAVRLSLAGRLDLLRDTFDPGVPVPTERLSARHSAFSPKAGINVHYLRRPRASGNVFVAAGRSFKAPTPDQLFDQRPIPVPFPPYTITTSNALLEPQRAASLEAGVYQDVTLGDWRAATSLGIYQMDLKNELDFDVPSLRYVNLGRSRHRGVELGLTLSGPPGASAFANYTLQSAHSRTGEHTNRQLKAIPRHVVAVGGSYAFSAGFEAGAMVTRLHRMYLDDANTRTIPAWSRVDARLGWRFRSLSATLDVMNVLDARYASTGFLDPAGTGEAYFHPAAGRQFRVGVTSGR